MRYDTVGILTLWFGKFGYFFWRSFRGDLLGGVSRRLRRARGIYLADCPQDNAEYHVTRNGVDQIAIKDFLTSSGFTCRIVPYFSTHSGLFQRMGSALGIENTFAVLARREDRTGRPTILHSRGYQSP